MGRNKRKTEEKPKEKEVQPEVLDTVQQRVGEQPDRGTSSVERVNSQPTKQVNPAKASFWRKKIKYHVTALRRSNRIQNTTVTAQNQDIQPAVQEIILSESDKEDEQDASMEEDLPNATSGEKSMEEKMDYISKLLEAQGKNMENLMSKGLKINSTNDSPNIRYKSLYINSQKKIETLTKENQDLSSKLEIALAKLEGFEKGTRVSAEWMQNLKDLTMISNFAQGVRNVLSSQEAHVQEPKRKKSQK